MTDDTRPLDPKNRDGHHGCDDALTKLYEYLDNELDENLRAQIEAHLAECSPCLEAFDFEAELRRVIADRCQERVPEELRRRILSVLSECDLSTSALYDPLAADSSPSGPV